MFKQLSESGFQSLPAIPISERMRDETPDLFVHPFAKGNLQSVDMTIRKDPFHPEAILFEACVRFQSGSSRGSHDLKGDGLQDLVNKINAFLKTL